MSRLVFRVKETGLDDQPHSAVLLVYVVQIAEAEIYFEGSCFKFYCKPYFLHLQLPGELKEDGHAKSSYDVDKGALGEMVKRYSVCACVCVCTLFHAVQVLWWFKCRS